MLIDFHTHSSASDGALSPADLLARAREAGVSLLAITDHDTTAGYLAVQAEAASGAAGMRLIAGIEYSCRWSGATIHVLGLGMDCAHPVMRRAVNTMEAARGERAEKIARRLEARGYPGALAGAVEQAGDSQLGRPHFAAWMVEQGHVADHNEAFDRYLGQGKIGDVKAFWPELAEVTRWIVESGGVAVLAHPLKYKFTGMKLRRLVAGFVTAGGAGIEVSSGRQTSDQTKHLKRIAKEFDLEASVGSDFHRDSPYGAPLGVELAPFADMRGVWERWLDHASL